MGIVLVVAQHGEGVMNELSVTHFRNVFPYIDPLSLIWVWQLARLRVFGLLARGFWGG